MTATSLNAPLSLVDASTVQLELARQAASGRSAVTVHGGHGSALRQTMIALRADERLAEHESPGEATLLVLEGDVALAGGGDTVGEVTGTSGDLLVIPNSRHSLRAISDAVVLLTVAVSGSRHPA